MCHKSGTLDEKCSWSLFWQAAEAGMFKSQQLLVLIVEGGLFQISALHIIHIIAEHCLLAVFHCCLVQILLGACEEVAIDFRLWYQFSLGTEVSVTISAQLITV